MQPLLVWYSTFGGIGEIETMTLLTCKQHVTIIEKVHPQNASLQSVDNICVQHVLKVIYEH